MIFLQSWTSTGYFSNSTGASVTNCRFTPIIEYNWLFFLFLILLKWMNQREGKHPCQRFRPWTSLHMPFFLEAFQTSYLDRETRIACMQKWCTCGLIIHMGWGGGIQHNVTSPPQSAFPSTNSLFHSCTRSVHSAIYRVHLQLISSHSGSYKLGPVIGEICGHNLTGWDPSTCNSNPSVTGWHPPVFLC